MTLKTQMTSDLSVFFNTDEFADTVSYTPAGGDAADISAIVDYGEDLDEQPGSAMSKGTLVVKVSDVAAPGYRDTVVIGSDTWTVRNIKSGDGYVWVLNIERDERPVL